MMRKKTTFGFAITCVLIAAVIAFAGGFAIASNKVKDVTDTGTGSSGYAQLDEVEKIINESYIGEVDKTNLAVGVCKGYVDSLGDKSVQYMTADEYAAYSAGTAGETIIYKNFGKGVGYMQFLGFSGSTKKSFTDALNDFSKSATSKVSMLVLDLRNCSTGDIEVVASLLDFLLPEGETIAGIDKKGTRTVLYTSDQSEQDYDIAVLVNGKTSGVAEIFASTLSAYNKAIIVGTTTAGSCAKTDAMKLSNGDYLLLPNMYYVTKGQQTYSTSGVVPTQIVELSVDQQKAYDSATLDISQDPQFVAAVKALGVNDIPTVGSDTDTDSDSDRNNTDTDTENSSDSDVTASENQSGAASDTSSTDESSAVDPDPYWDDDDYWNSVGNDSSGDDGQDNDYNGDDYYDDGYYYDDYYYE